MANRDDWPARWTNIFTGNVNVQAFEYQPGTPMLEVTQDAADADWPDTERRRDQRPVA